MKTTVQIPRVLSQYSGGKLSVEARGGTVGAVLLDLQKTYPLLYGCICDETGRLRRHINLFINNKLLLQRESLSTKLNHCDVVSVFQAVSGG